MYDGMINVFKEKGYTSHDVVACLRGILHQKKIGHTGTLDPDATGVLPVCLGKGTKLCDMITDHDKTYRTVMRLGRITDTQDISGKILKESAVEVSEEDIRQTAASFVGVYMQTPPMYSALKVNGKKLYELARAGQEVERKPRRVEIYSLTVESIHIPFAEMEVTCSKGTYIRTLCQDIGEKLGCGACMAELVRTRVGRFTSDEAYKLSEIEKLAACGEEAVRSHMVSLEEMLADFDSVKAANAICDKMLYNGNTLPASMVCGMDDESILAASDDGISTMVDESISAASDDEISAMSNGGTSAFAKDGQQVRVYSSSGEFVAIYRYDAKTESFKNVKMFI